MFDSRGRQMWAQRGSLVDIFLWVNNSCAYLDQNHAVVSVSPLQGMLIVWRHTRTLLRVLQFCATLVSIMIFVEMLQNNTLMCFKWGVNRGRPHSCGQVKSPPGQIGVSWTLCKRRLNMFEYLSTEMVQHLLHGIMILHFVKDILWKKTFPSNHHIAILFLVCFHNSVGYTKNVQFCWGDAHMVSHSTTS